MTRQVSGHDEIYVITDRENYKDRRRQVYGHDEIGVITDQEKYRKEQDDDDEFNYLSHFVKRGMHIWIGLYAPNPSDNTNRIWSDDGSSPIYENWSSSKTEGAGYLCTYTVVQNSGLEWNLADCDTEKKSFMCEEDKRICTTGVYYTFTKWHSGSFTGSFYLSPATVQDCVNICEWIIANYGVCWGFVFRVTTNPNACLTYDDTDDPYYNIINQQASGNHYNYIRNCNLTIHVLSQCPACFPTTEVTTLTEDPTTEVHTTTDDHTTEVHTTTEDRTTRVQTTMEAGEMTTEDRTASIKDDATTKYRTTETTLENEMTTEDHATAMEDDRTTDDLTKETTKENAMTTEDGTTTMKDETTTGEKTTQTTIEVGLSISNTTSPQRGSSPYCTCTCQNVTTTLSLEESIQKIVNNIKVDSRKMSSYTRKLTSAKDSRPSSENIGYFGIVMLSTIFGMLVVLDFQRFIGKCCTIFKSKKDLLK
ncbi:unnamed protein product [Mytilus coruscus]|uniref:C-type lectin domain-containing protein n=1 Tax=Mytilus coruscus TaxID=42192 RepID=A0A6J8C5F9_MYTCO|nr:unnamed protein product [Mytilus coruscus]